MRSIYASKLYQASHRKDRIHAALAAPGNMGLVQQLADSLDEEYQTPENLGVEDQGGNGESSQPDFILDEEINPETDLVTMDDVDNKPKGNSKKSGSSPSSSKRRSSGPRPLGPKPKLDDDDPSGDKPDTPDKPDSSAEPSGDEPTEAATQVMGSSEIDLTILRDSLNSRGDTCGASRVVEKDDEIWIYYKDEVNLNNIMAEVIEYIMNAGYTSLEFNRLARSDNAIVFQIIDSTPVLEREED